MYEEHEDGSFTLHMCEWYEQGRRLVGEYETLADGSGFAVTDEWPAGLKVVVNHQLTRPDGTVMPGISRIPVHVADHEVMACVRVRDRQRGACLGRGQGYGLAVVEVGP